MRSLLALVEQYGSRRHLERDDFFIDQLLCIYTLIFNSTSILPEHHTSHTEGIDGCFHPKCRAADGDPPYGYHRVTNTFWYLSN